MNTNNQTMHVKDACKILDISGDINDEEVKRAYQRACIKFHPDKGGSVEMMKLV